MDKESSLTILFEEEVGKMKNVYIYSNGCSSSMLDGERMAIYFEKNNYSLTYKPNNADLLVVNTCAFDAISEKDSIEKIKSLQNLQSNNKKIIVCGCLPAINKQKMREVFKGDYFIPKSEETWSKLDKILDAKIPISKIKDPSVLSHRWQDWKLIGVYKAFKGNICGKDITGYDENAYHIRVATGCTSNCSFCAIRFARGYIKSKTIKDITNEFKKGLKKGFKSFKLWADDIGDYGVDIGTDLSELLSEILSIKEDFELEVLSTNPKKFIELYDQLSLCLEDKRVIYFNISIQSGSSSILKMMKRDIDLKKLSTLIRQLKKRASHLIIRTHYMVGFPGETWQDLIATLIYTLKIRNFKYLILVYDPKPNTEAAKMEKQIPKTIKNIRFNILKWWGIFWARLLEDGRTY